MGQTWKSVNDVLDYAIREEQQAVFVYRAMGHQAPSEGMKELFGGLEADETSHLKKLLKLRKATTFTVTDGSLSTLPHRRTVRLPADGVVDAEAAYKFAIRAERNARELYWLFSQMAAEPAIQQLLGTLAAEEQAHEAKLEADLAKRRTQRGFLRRLFRFGARRP